MSEKMFVKPAPGLKVRLPENPGAFLPDEGAEVARDAFWSRRLAEGDVQEAQMPRAQGGAGAADVVASTPAKTAGKSSPRKE